MKKNGKNEELQSRREFFKRAAKGALPILAGAALLSSPILSETANAMSCAGCNNRCMNSCFNTLKSYIYNSVAELRKNRMARSSVLLPTPCVPIKCTFPSNFTSAYGIWALFRKIILFRYLILHLL